MARSGVVATLVAWSGLVAACAGGGAEFYTLTPAAPPPIPALASDPELGLLVGPVAFPRYLDRPELVARDGEHALQISDDHRWGGSLRDDISRALGADLGARLGTPRVAVHPAAPSFPVRYRVRVDIQEFGGVRGGNVTLRARWSVAPGDSEEALAVEDAVLTEPTSDDSWDAYVAAHEALLSDLGRGIAERIAQLASR